MTDFLVTLARKAINAHIRGGDPRAELAGRPVGPPRACFVTLKKGERLRGCMGTTVPTKASVEEEVIANALASATRDPRFKPVRAGELAKILISVDLLSPTEPVDSLQALDPRIYGVVVRAGARAGLLLPDLPGVDTVERQIEICREKGGIQPEEEVTLERFFVERLSQ